MCKVSGRNFKGDKIFFTQEVDGLEHAAREMVESDALIWDTLRLTLK